MQVYVRDVASRLPRPYKELKGFARIELERGETRRARILLADDAFEYYDPAFKAACRANKESIVIAANNFGCGSSREQAVYAVKYNNVIAVVAQSFPDIFYRNSLNNGLLPIQVSDTSGIREGDELVIDLDARMVQNVTRGDEFPFTATDSAIEQMKTGGFLGHVRERLRMRLAAGTAASR